MLLVAKVDQRVEAIRAFDDNVAATPAVPAVGTAELDEFLAPGTRPRPPRRRRSVRTRALDRGNFIASCLSRGARQVDFRLAPRRDGACPIRASKAQAMAFDQPPARRGALQARAEKRETHTSLARSSRPRSRP